LYGRSIAKRKKGDAAAADADAEAAKRLQPKIASEFQDYGVQ
jgi:hypothetical protein